MAPRPALFHNIRSQVSILTLLVSNGKIYAGTQNGDIVIWSLDSYELLSTIRAHRGSVLCLYLSADQKLLLSSAGDAIVNVWTTENLNHLYSIYSKYDVGDVFCVAYSPLLQTIYLGAQNTSIQWYNLSHKDVRPAPDPTAHPLNRNHRFFDSKGPTGLSTPRLSSTRDFSDAAARNLEIDKDHIVQYAHYGYVYCMLLAQELPSERQGRETLISGGGDGTIKLWSLDHEAQGAISEPTSLENGDDSVLALALDGTLLYSGRLEGDVNVWDLDTHQLIRSIKVQDADILTLAVGHGLIFCGTSDGEAKIYNSRHANVSHWTAHENLILASVVTSLNDQELYVTGGNDGCISIWDISDCFERPAKGQITSNEQLVMSLEKFVSYRTISSKTEFAQDCRRGASFLRNLFKRFGAETELFNTENGRNPVVFARFRGRRPRCPVDKTILFYGHYDVVAAENKGQTWNADPFELQGINGYLYGRGVSDNKGPILAAVYAVADIVRLQQLSSDIVFLIEGEEESGSQGFQKTVRKNKRKIGNVDWILLANSYWLNDDIPCLTYGLRGVVRARIQVASERPDLHSGVDGSRLIHEALKDLVALVATLTSADGRVSLPGFYKDIPPITKAENELYNAISETLLRQNPELGDAADLTASFKARWREPSLTIHSIENSGPTNSAIISRTAKADFSIRIVPNQTSTAVIAMLQDHLSKAFQALDTTNEMKIEIEHRAEPWLGDPDNQIFRTLHKAIMDTWQNTPQERCSSISSTKRSSKELADGLRSPKLQPATSSTLSNSSASVSKADKSKKLQSPLYIREGGSIPAIRFLEQEFGAPAAHLPCGQASDCAHLDNERLRILNLYKSREIFRRIFTELGQ